MDDHELLREFVHKRSEEAFRRLVERHLSMVLSAARRITNDDHLAQDVTQVVFTTFAQKAGGIRPPQVIGGWLYNTTRHLAMHAVRGEQRRREREEVAAAMQPTQTKSDTDRVIELLEPAMDQLAQDDRDTLVLRYLEDRNLREVGAELGISEDAARMRANRALERLRAVLDHRGVSVTSVVLATVLVSGTGSAVPAGMAGAITTAALAGTILSTATITTMNWINAKAVAAIVGAAVIAGTSTYLVKQDEVVGLRTENQNLLAKQAALAADQEASVNAALSNKAELERFKQETGELLRLRNEVGQLRRERDADRQRFAQELTRIKPAPPTTATTSGISLTRANLANVGYATPEAALQTITWATMSDSATPEQIAEGLAPELLQDRQAYSAFESNRKESSKVFKSVDMLAKKTLSDNKVEFKVAFNADLGPNGPQIPPSVMVLPMTRLGNEWKLAGNPQEYEQPWEQDGQVQAFGR